MKTLIVRRASGVAAFAIAAACAQVSAATSKIWVCDSAFDFSAGEARGVSVTMDGTLVLARQAKRVDGVAEAALFCAATDPEGVVWLGTGDAGKILRVPASGKVETVATLPETEVTAVAIGPDGAVYAGASPGGKVYRVEKGKASLYYETGARYVWALAFSGSGLYVGTGLPGEIHRVSSAGHGERLHATPDPHVRSLFPDAEGRVWAGTAGSGLVLCVEKSGAVRTLYDSSKSEITSIAPGAGGRVWVAAGSADIPAVGGEPASVPTAPPSVRPTPAPREAEPGKEKPEVTVTVSAVRLAPSKPGGQKGGYSSEVVLFDEGEPPRQVWSSSEELVFALEPDADGVSALVGTGPNGKLYRLREDHWTLERTLDEKQITLLTGNVLATNSPSAVFRLLDGPREGQYVSAVKDTGRTSRFGAFRFEGETPAGSRQEFSFRSGESGNPDSTWSAWSAFAAASRTLAAEAPAGRYIQWRVRMAADAGKLPAVRRVEVAYRNRNSAPVVESLVALLPSEVFARSASGGSNVFETTAPDEKGIFTSLEEAKPEGAPRKLMRKGYRTLSWKASDPDADTLTYDLEFRPAVSQRWVSLKRGLLETFYSFDSTALPDGDYVFRVTASDSEANPEDKKTASRESSPVRIDNTPPVIRRLSGAPGVFEFEASDASSPILDAEYSVDAREWVHLEPRDGLADSPAETYAIRLDPKWRGSFLLLRVTDAAYNVAASSFILP
ncbi:MAG: hypothetical protein ACRD1P_11145 [Thermoanaerobaculia bacterium]